MVVHTCHGNEHMPPGPCLACEVEKHEDRYAKACHAIQSGVAFEHGRGSEDGSPKHLRVGVNLRAVDHAALVRLLLAKGIISELEYVEALADAAEEEQKRYEARAAKALGNNSVSFA